MKNILITLFLVSTSLGLSFAQEASSNLTEAAPIFAKGKMSIDQFFKIYLNYPEEALMQEKTGIVKVSLSVQKDGEPTNPVIVQGVDASLDAEALRVVALFPYFTPAKKAGENIKTDIIVPVKFVLGIADQASSIESVASNEKFPLYVIDGKIVNDNIKVNAEEIESVRVMKGKKAIEKFGERAVDGAIVITTKRVTQR